MGADSAGLALVGNEILGIDGGVKGLGVAGCVPSSIESAGVTESSGLGVAAGKGSEAAVGNEKLICGAGFTAGVGVGSIGMSEGGNRYTGSDHVGNYFFLNGFNNRDMFLTKKVSCLLAEHRTYRFNCWYT